MLRFILEQRKLAKVTRARIKGIRAFYGYGALFIKADSALAHKLEGILLRFILEQRKLAKFTRAKIKSIRAF